MIQFDPASFRDPAGRLFRHDGAIYRTCSPDALATLKLAEQKGLLAELQRQGLLLETTLVERTATDLPAEVGDIVVRQRELPVVSYPYEWSFSMLRDAALTTLRALEACLGRGFVLKDATAFNVLFEGTVPRLVDVHSIEVRAEGSLWAGYAQFCRSFLFPLLLMSHRGIDPRPLQLAGLGEIAVGDTARLLTLRDRLKPGVLVHVAVQNQLERKFAGRAEDVSRAGGKVKYPISAIRSQVGKLAKLVQKLPLPTGDAWTTYVDTHTYASEEVRRKESFVAAAVDAVQPRLVLDLGTNTGQYARLARSKGCGVVAVDYSSPTIDVLYRASRGDTSLSPLVADLAKPTPPAGWRLVERRSLLDRLKGDFLLALALIHHVRITGGIPLSEIVQLLTGLAPNGIIEWVGRDDSMVKRLLALRPDVYDDYTQEHFERLLTAHGRIERSERLSADRTAYWYSR